MLALSGFQDTAVRMFHQRIDGDWLTPDGQALPLREMLDTSSLDWLIPELLRLLETEHRKPLDSLAPTVRKLVLDHEMVPPVSSEASQEDNELLHQAIVMCMLEVLGQIRDLARRSGQLSDAPITPLMCG